MSFLVAQKTHPNDPLEEIGTNDNYQAINHRKVLFTNNNISSLLSIAEKSKSSSPRNREGQDLSFH